jgi:transcriptional regulator with XRE-family HTH domain
MYLNTNLKFLRTRNKLTQQDLANALELGRSALNGYEHQQSVPTIETILKISSYFKISVDTLLKVDLKKLPESKISELEKGIEDGSTIQNFDIENFSYTLDDIIMELETIGEFEFLSDEEADGEELDLDIDNDDY